MNEETVIALRNYDWLIRNRGLDDVTIDWATESVVYGDGGAALDASLLQPGFTPATSEEALNAALTDRRNTTVQEVIDLDSKNPEDTRDDWPISTGWGESPLGI